MISIIIPVYNVNEYLDKCMESVLNQSFKDYEILLVDDGSTDGSADKCDKYASKYANVKVFHKKNGGLSDARNYGIKRSNAEYITFVDSDDYVTNDYLEYLYSMFKSDFKVDITVAGTFVVDDAGRTLREFRKYPDGILTPKEALSTALYQDAFDISAWGKMYKKKLFNTKQFSKGKLFEDLDLVPYLILDSTLISYGNQSKYYYLQRENSIVSSQFSEKKMELIDISEDLLKEITHSSLRPALVRRNMYSNIYLLNQIIKEDSLKKNQENCRKIKKNIGKYRREFLGDSEASTRDKGAIYLIHYLGIYLYAIIFKSLYRG